MAPTECPACAATTMQEKAIVRCPARDCPAQLLRRLEHFAARKSLAIDGLGAATARALVEAGLVHDLADLYRLDATDLPAMRAAGIATPDQLLAAIAERKHAPMWRYLVGLGIPGVGPATARKLARACPDFDRLLAATPASLERDAHLGPATADRISSFLQDPAIIEIVRALQRNGVRPGTGDGN